MESDIFATPVANQQRAGTCWSYATGGLVEAEMLRMGKPPVNLSEMFVVRMCYEEKAKRLPLMLQTYLKLAMLLGSAATG